MNTDRRILIYFGMALALALIVLCFPFPMGGDHSCILDGWMDRRGSELGGGSSDLVQRYVVPFGLMWWFGLGAAYVLWRVARRGVKRGRRPTRIDGESQVFAQKPNTE